MQSLSTSERKHLETQLDEQKRNYDRFSKHIEAVNTSLGRTLDSEQRLTLEDRRTELEAQRNDVVARMVQIEAQLAQIAEPPPIPNVVPVRPAPTDLVTIEKPINLELIRIPAGEFRMGGDWPRGPTSEFRMGGDEICIDVAEFYIGKYPITNAQYAAFVQGKRHEPPWHWEGGRIAAGKGNHPVAYVSWNDAVAFCEWLSREAGREFRLPTEAEWEKAARGTDGRAYPWGNEPPTKENERCNFKGSSIGGTTPVGLYRKGASPYGILDMAGNVWEWCSSVYDDYPYNAKDGRESLTMRAHRVLRGGSFGEGAFDGRCAVRNYGGPSGCSEDRGFRVGWTPPTASDL